ncbi:MAG: LamG-like jellyroll fold domain-containing protein, partial [Patescibacteria group bacterium]
ILVAVLIVALISTLVMISLSNSRSKGRDLKRINDVNQIQVALENYKNVEGRYPEQLIPGESLVGSSSGLVFLSEVPDKVDYYYNTLTLSYDIGFEVENTALNFSPGIKCANADGILESACCRDYCLDYLGFVSSSGGFILNENKTYNLFHYFQNNNIYENLILFLSSDGGLKIDSSSVDGVGEIYDLSLNKKNAIQTNIDLQPKLINGFVYFDGVDDFFNISTMPKQTEYSLALWLDGTKPQGSGGLLWGTGLSLGRWGLALYSGKIASQNSIDSIDRQWWPIEDYILSKYPDGWHFIVLTDDGSFRRFYKNGQLISEIENTVMNIGTDKPMFLGKGGSTTESYFQGRINDAMYFNKALSAEEVLSLYDNTKKYYKNY